MARKKHPVCFIDNVNQKRLSFNIKVELDVSKAPQKIKQFRKNSFENICHDSQAKFHFLFVSFRISQMASGELVSFEMTFLLHFGLDDDMLQSFAKAYQALISPQRIVIHKPITIVRLARKKSIKIQLKNWGWWSSIGDWHRFISFYDWFMSQEILVRASSE